MKSKKVKEMKKVELLRTLLAILVAVICAVAVIFLVSKEPVNAMYMFFVAPFTSTRYLASIIELMTPLLFTGLAVTFILQTKVYILAVEGMFYAGGLCSALVATLMSMGAGIHAVTALLIGAIAGSLVAFIPAILKLKFEANEIVSSLMLNYIVFFVGDYLLKTYMKDAKSTHVVSLRFKETAKLIRFSKGIHFGLVIAIVLLVVAYIFLYHTRWGYAIRMCGENKRFAKYSGIGVTSTILLSQIIGGALAGLGGAAYMLGSNQRMNWEWRSGYGWDGLVVAIVARLNPKFVPVGAFLRAELRIGSDIMSRNTDVQNEVVSIIQGVIIILISAAGFLAKYKKKMTVKIVKETKGA